MNEMGHTDPALTLAVYTAEMSRDDGEKARLAALVDGGVPAPVAASPTPPAPAPPERPSVEAVRHPENGSPHLVAADPPVSPFPPSWVGLRGACPAVADAVLERVARSFDLSQPRPHAVHGSARKLGKLRAGQ